MNYQKWNKLAVKTNFEYKDKEDSRFVHKWDP